MSFITEIQDYVSGFSDTAAADAWLTYGAKIVIDLLPIEKAEKFSADLSAVQAGIDTTGHRVLRAHKSGYNARKIAGGLKAQAGSSDSIYAATATDPVYYEENGKGYVQSGANPGTGTIIGVAYPTVTNTASTITKFPAEYYGGVVLYAAIRAIIQEIDTMTALGTNEDIELSEMTLKTLATQRQSMEADYKEFLAEVQVGK
jgi:hypothetical protein